jgi:hypothetical protein
MQNARGLVNFKSIGKLLELLWEDPLVLVGGRVSLNSRRLVHHLSGTVVTERTNQRPLNEALFRGQSNKNQINAQIGHSGFLFKPTTKLAMSSGNCFGNFDSDEGLGSGMDETGKQGDKETLSSAEDITRAF